MLLGKREGEEGEGVKLRSFKGEWGINILLFADDAELVGRLRVKL